MIKTAKYAPPNSLLLVEDMSNSIPPAASEIGLCIVTLDCIVLACLSFCDGETAITLGAASEVVSPWPIVVDSILRTPSKRVVVRTVEEVAILDMEVSETKTRVRVWTNRVVEPDIVMIGLAQLEGLDAVFGASTK